MKYLISKVFIHPAGVLPPEMPPEEAEPDVRFEAYDAQFSETAPEVGDRLSFEEQEWIAQRVYAYEPLEQVDSPTERVYEVWYTQPTDEVCRSDWSNQNRYYAYYSVGVNGSSITGEDWMPSGFVWDLKNLPKLDKPLRGHSNWQVQSLQRFSLVGDRPESGFDEIVLCWCKQDVEAIAA